MRALRLTVLVGVLLLAQAVAGAAAPSPSLRLVLESFTNSGAVDLRCMGSYNRAVALGLPRFTTETTSRFGRSGSALMAVVGPSRDTWLTFCLTLRHP